AAFWQQIGTAFRDHGDHLLFAGTNEVHVQGDYGPPAPENAEVQNGFNQTFVTTVRATGGRNRNRWLVVQGYNTDIDHSLKWNLTLPEDSARNRLMMELHYYTPYNFTLNEQSPVWQWGRGASSPAATDGWGNEDFVEDRFRKVQEAFGARGIPVILGEYGAYTKPSRPAGRRYVLRWVRSITEAASRSGMIPMYWDTGTERGIIHRTTGQVQDPELLRALVDSDLRGRGLARVGRSSP
ncbi:MAG: glycoside hydrolase family 5 protein, partial [Fimbriimonadaceae bacterium]|nr:glycoside hydrolase family 5 protein [Fimbriimonadaceae bacterium]